MDENKDEGEREGDSGDMVEAFIITYRSELRGFRNNVEEGGSEELLKFYFFLTLP